MKGTFFTLGAIAYGVPSICLIAGTGMGWALFISTTVSAIAGYVCGRMNNDECSE